MATDLPVRPIATSQAYRVAIVASEYHPEYVEGLVHASTAEFAVLAPATRVEVFRVPGSFEIALGVDRVAALRQPDAVLAFGVLFDGETLHASLIAESVTASLLQTSLKYHLPVLHEILVVKTPEQARARCLDEKLNRGVEAARATVRMLGALACITSSEN
ncbi:MAG TPA: 6,7-dimethyl-8-ribityllumazine synthase [Chthoniobacterales bacterium]